MTTPSFFDSTGLTILVYNSGYTAGAYVAQNSYHDNITDKISSYNHKIDAVGGYGDMSFTLQADRVELEDWLQNGVGRHIEVYNQGLVLVWEGFVDEISLTFGPYGITTGPLLGTCNRASVVYSTFDNTLGPPAMGSREQTLYANDTTAQAKYGVIEKVLSVGGMNETSAEGIRDLYLLEMADLKPSQQFSIDGSSVQAVVTCRGYKERMKTYTYFDTTTGTENASAKIASVLNDDPNAMFSSTNASIATNTFQVDAQDVDNRYAWNVITDVLNIGDGTNRYLFGVYGGRKSIYERASTSDITYQISLGDPTLTLQEYGSGAVVDPWDIVPGRWIFVSDMLIGTSIPTDLRTDPRFIFIESVAFSAPYNWSVEGGRLDTLKQRIAALGLSGIGA